MNNVSFYIIVGILYFTILLLLNHSYADKAYKQKGVKELQWYLYTAYAYIITDTIWEVLYASHNSGLLFADTILYNDARAVSILFCCRYVVAFLNLKDLLGKILNSLGVIFCISELIFMAINPIFPIFFTFDETDSYQGGVARYIVIIMQLILFGYISIVSLVTMKGESQQIQNRNRVIAWFGAIMATALIAQNFITNFPCYTSGIVLGVLVIHIFIHTEELSVMNVKLSNLYTEKSEQFNIAHSLAKSYDCLYYINLDTGHFQAQKPSALKEVALVMGTEGDAKEKFRQISQYLIPSEYEAEAMAFTNISTLAERLKDTDSISWQFYGNPPGWYEGTFVAAARNKDGVCTHAVWAVRNITLQKEKDEQQRKELERALDNAEAANAAKTSFLFSMSHDIRTPMNAIIGFRDLLEKHQEDPERRKDYLSKIENSSNVLLSIINNVLEMARIEKGSIILDEIAWSAEQFNETLYSIFDLMMKEKGLTFTREIHVTNPFVFCDPIKMREVFINIISNAYKYTNPGGKIHMKVEEIPSDREGWAVYRTSISDTGIGMSEDFLPRIFEEFTRENNTTENKIEGTGLGMPIVKRLVELMNGTIEVTSKKGVGSTFIVTLPHRIADKDDLTDHDKVAEINFDIFEGKRILLAEDNDLNAEIAMEILGEVGFLVERADDGAVCRDMIAQSAENYYDVILMDIQMPNMNGYEATRAIRQLADPGKAYIPIIAMTANAFEEDKRESMRSGMNGHLGKPIDVNLLMKTLSGVFARKQNN